MLIEKSLEEKIITAISSISGITNCFIEGSRGAAAAGFVKSEDDVDAAQIIAVSIGVREYDSFSIPTANITGAIALTTRAEMCPTGAEHEGTLELIVDKLNSWHKDGSAMTAALSIPNYFHAAGLRLDGGQGKTFIKDRGFWTETISFTIRGTILV